MTFLESKTKTKKHFQDGENMNNFNKSIKIRKYGLY